MIGRLRGTIVYCSDDHVLIDVNGVGFVVYCSETTLSRLPQSGNTITLYTDMMVREDLIQLSGFLFPAERELYRYLLTIQGVGARAAQSVVGTLGVSASIRAISLGDWETISLARFVGKRISQRIVNELKDKVALLIAKAGELGIDHDTIETPIDINIDNKNQDKPDSISVVRAECLSALMNLGYQQGEAARAIALASKDDTILDTPGLIKHALAVLYKA